MNLLLCQLRGLPWHDKEAQVQLYAINMNEFGNSLRKSLSLNPQPLTALRGTASCSVWEKSLGMCLSCQFFFSVAQNHKFAPKGFYNLSSMQHLTSSPQTLSAVCQTHQLVLILESSSLVKPKHAFQLSVHRNSM